MNGHKFPKQTPPQEPSVMQVNLSSCIPSCRETNPPLHFLYIAASPHSSLFVSGWTSTIWGNNTHLHHKATTALEEHVSAVIEKALHSFPWPVSKQNVTDVHMSALDMYMLMYFATPSTFCQICWNGYEFSVLRYVFVVLLFASRCGDPTVWSNVNRTHIQLEFCHICYICILAESVKTAAVSITATQCNLSG